jgi:chorismate-pyruvate lyase
VTAQMDSGSTPETPAEVEELLRHTDRPLGAYLESAFGSETMLVVIAQSNAAPPHPQWVAPPLRDDRALLFRATSYRLASETLSWNLAYVDEERIEPRLASALRRKEVHLGLVLGDSRFAKRPPETGTQEDGVEIAPLLREAFSLPTLGAFAWRRYVVESEGAAVMVVVEALPSHICRQLLLLGQASYTRAKERR